MDKEERRKIIKKSINMFDTLEKLNLDYIEYKSLSKKVIEDGSVCKISERLKKEVI